MNILLVCGNGITTNILAAKLQKYAQENGKQDYFSACRVSQYSELLSRADLVLIAPQAALMADGLRKEAGQLEVPCRQITEEAFVLGQMEKIYADIEAVRARPTVRPEPVKLTPSLLGRILVDGALYSVPILMFGLVCLILGKLSSASILLDASRATLSLLALYFMFSVGYQYGVVTRREPVGRGLIALGAPLLMLPMGGVIEVWNVPFRMVAGQIPLDFFALPNALFLVVLSAAAVAMVYQLDKIKFPASVSAIPMMESMVKMSAVFLLFVVLRCFLAFL